MIASIYPIMTGDDHLFTDITILMPNGEPKILVRCFLVGIEPAPERQNIYSAALGESASLPGRIVKPIKRKAWAYH